MSNNSCLISHSSLSGIFMNNLHKQRGMGMINLVLLIVVVAFCGTFAFKIVPIFAENRYVISGLKELVQKGENRLEQMSDAEIQKAMSNFYMVNNVRSSAPQKIVISRSSNRVVVKVDYESRANFIYNVDLLVSFKNHLDSAHPNQCCNPVDDVSVKSKY
jgi:hypothetical protein